MIENLSEYFLPDYQYYLENISFNRLSAPEENNNYEITGTDNIEANIKDDRIILTIRRTIEFDPEAIFKLTVAFGAELYFNPERRDEFDWNNINMATEFRKHGDFVTNTLMSRISLLIGEITSSFGHEPLIVNPMIAKG